jgi:Mrp family chromosome partitioning ATPase
MSRNFEVLYRMGQEQDAIAAESSVDVTALLDVRATHTSEDKASRPADAFLDFKATHTSERKASSPADAEILRLVQVLFLSSPNAPRCVLFCGVGTGAGGGNVCMAAAKALSSEVSSRVCLVDAKIVGASPQRPSELDESILPSSKSLEQRGFVAQQIGSNLWFVSVESVGAVGVPNRSTLQMCSGFLELRKEFGYLLIEAPPLGNENIASVLGQVTDGVVLVLEANATRRVTARNAKQILETANVRLLGTVLNNRTFPIPEKLYRRL